MTETPQTLYCTDCGTALHDEQFQRLFQGEIVYCEKCGKQFQAKTIKIDSNSPNSESKFASIGLSLKQSSKKIEKGAKKFISGTKKFGKQIKEKIEETKERLSEDEEAEKPKSSQHPNYNYTRDYEQKTHNPSQYANSTSSHSRNGFNFWGRQTPSYASRQAPPPISPRYSYFRRMNMVTLTLTLIHLLVYGLVVIMQMLPNIQTGSETFASDLFGALVPVGIGCVILAYDFFWVKNKIENRDLQNYGIDFMLIGLIGAIFGYGIGIYLAIKGFIVMFIAITDSAVFGYRYKRSFGDVLTSLFNLFASILGFVILGFKNPLTIPLDNVGLIYFYLAFGALVIDLIFLHPIAKNRRLQEIPISIAILKLVLGVVACFHFWSGIVLVIEGAFMVLAVLFRE